MLCNIVQAKWGQEYEKTLFSGGMTFSDGGRVVENKMLNAVVEQGGFVAAFTGQYPALLHFFLLKTHSRLLPSANKSCRSRKYK